MWFLQSADWLHAIWLIFQGGGNRGYSTLNEISGKIYWENFQNRKISEIFGSFNDEASDFWNFPPNALIFIDFLKFLNLINRYLWNKKRWFFLKFKKNVEKYVGSSTETVAFQVYEILKICHEFFQFFHWDQKYKCLRHHFQYLTQFIAPRVGSGVIQIFRIHDYGTSFAVISTTMDFPSS